MSFSSLPLSYCTNVHPGRSVAEVEDGLDRYTIPVARGFGRPLSAGLWLARPVVNELLASEAALMCFADGLARRGLTCHTLNAFPYGDFHSDRVKDDVYRPDWSTADRLDYTLGAARALAALLPEGVDGSVSTLPLAFKAHPHPSDFAARCERKLIAAATALKELHDQPARTIRLAVEPEPLCDLETTDEAIAFFRRLWVAAENAGASAAVREYVGLCYDVCHQAVEFEDV